MNFSKLRFRCGVVLSLLLIAVMLFAQAPNVSNVSTVEATNATVCELVHRSKDFNGKIVRVNALVESDLIEHTALTDESCKSYGVSLWIPHDLDDDASVKVLRSALREQWKPGAAKTRVFGVFIGTFSVEGKKRFLKVSKVEDVQVRGT